MLHKGFLSTKYLLDIDNLPVLYVFNFVDMIFIIPALSIDGANTFSNSSILAGSCRVLNVPLNKVLSNLLSESLISL
nr:MAG: hypothetical protein [Bacteriophage sp.]